MLKNFFLHDLWSLGIGSYPRWKRMLYGALRVLVLVYRGFTSNSVQLRASALTFYTVLSLVPVLAMGFGIAKGFGLEAKLKALILEKLSSYPEVAVKLVEFSKALLERTGGGLIAGIGVGLLFWSAIKVFLNIEKSFNAIWGVELTRSWMRRFSDYLSMMIIAPLLIIAASSSNVLLRSTISRAAANADFISAVTPYMKSLLRLAPYVLVSLVLGLLYIVMPNTRVRVKSGLTAGLVAGSGFAVTQWAYLYFQFGISKYNAIYGSFAAIPLFLVWMQLSWLIVLIGAQLAYAMQNVDLFVYEEETHNLSPKRTKELSLLLLSTIAIRFRDGLSPFSADELAAEHHLPIQLTKQLLHWMTDVRLVATVVGETGKDTAYQLGKSLDTLTVNYVLEQYDGYGSTIEAEGRLLEKLEGLYDRCRPTNPVGEIRLDKVDGEEGCV